MSSDGSDEKQKGVVAAFRALIFASASHLMADLLGCSSETSEEVRFAAWRHLIPMLPKGEYCVSATAHNAPGLGSSLLGCSTGTSEDPRFREFDPS